jgi:hypothetical protein
MPYFPHLENGGDNSTGSPPILGLITSGFDQAWTKKKRPKKNLQKQKI